MDNDDALHLQKGALVVDTHVVWKTHVIIKTDPVQVKYEKQTVLMMILSLLF